MLEYKKGFLAIHTYIWLTFKLKRSLNICDVVKIRKKRFIKRVKFVF